MPEMCLANLHAGTATESLQVMTWMKSILFLQKITPHCQDFCILMSCSMVAVCSEKLKWANNGYKLNEQVGL